MSPPGGNCSATATYYNDGVPEAGPFEFEWDCENGGYHTENGLQSITWNGVAWIHSDPFGETSVGGTDPDDASGTYTGNEFYDEILITVEEGSCSCLSDSSVTSSHSGSGKYYSSVSESSASVSESSASVDSSSSL